MTTTVSATPLAPERLADWVLTDGRSVWVRWGGISRAVTNRTRPTVTDTTVTPALTPIIGEAGVTPGQDRAGQFSVEFDTQAFDVGEARAFAAAWGGGRTLQPGEHWRLTGLYEQGPLTCFGRPRALGAVHPRFVGSKVTYKPVFDALQPYWFGPLRESTVEYRPVLVSTGFVFPAVFAWGASSTGTAAATIGTGGEPGVPVLKVNGPITNPEIRFGTGQQLKLRADILAGRHITVDCTPMSLSVLDEAGNSRRGAVTLDSTRLRDLRIPSAPTTLTFAGSSPAATATLDISYRPVHAVIY